MEQIKTATYVAAKTPNGSWALWDELLGMPIKLNLSERQIYSELSYRLAGGKRAQAEIEQALKEPERWQAWLTEVQRRHNKSTASALERKCCKSSPAPKRAWITRGELIAELQISTAALKKYVDRGVAPDGRHIRQREVLEEERLRGAYHPHIRAVYLLVEPPPEASTKSPTPPQSKEGTMSTPQINDDELRWMPMSHLAKELGVAMSTMHHWISKGESPEDHQVLTRDVTPEDNQHPNVKQLVALAFSTQASEAEVEEQPAQAPTQEDDELAELREKNATLQAALIKRDEQAQADQEKIQRLSQAFDREREVSISLDEELQTLKQELMSTRQVVPAEPVQPPTAPWASELLALLHAHRYVLGESDPRVWRLLYEAQVEVQSC